MLLPTITTFYQPNTKHNWRSKIKEINKLSLTKVGLFLTCVNQAERAEIYQKLKKHINQINPICSY